MPSYEFTVVGDPTRAKHTAANALEAKDFVMQWSDDWTATAIKGSKVKACGRWGQAQRCAMCSWHGTNALRC